MSWLTEVRQAVAGLDVQTTEMSDAVVVKFEQAWLWFSSDRSTELSSNRLGDAPVLGDAESATMQTIVGRLDRRIWRGVA